MKYFFYAIVAGNDCNPLKKVENKGLKKKNYLYLPLNPIHFMDN
jgi:hypothetical protein